MLCVLPAFFFVKKGECAGDEKKDAERFSQEGSIHHTKQQCARGSADDTGRDRRAQELGLEIAVFAVCREGKKGCGQKKEQIDLLGERLLHIQKERHAQKQQRSAADAPCGENAGAEAEQSGEEVFRHSRYRAPP